MYQLDEQFLIDVGLGSLPEEQKLPFLQHTYDQLEHRVGIRLSEGMSEEQLREFELIIERQEDHVTAWLSRYVPDYPNDPLFQRLAQAMGLPAEHIDLKGEYAATKWLEVNRPDYRDVVTSTLNEIKQEIISNRDSILGTSSAPQSPAA